MGWMKVKCNPPSVKSNLFLTHVIEIKTRVMFVLWSGFVLLVLAVFSVIYYHASHKKKPGHGSAGVNGGHGHGGGGGCSRCAH